MKTEKTVMSIRKYRFWKDIVDGISWVLAGILAFMENMPCMIMCFIVLLSSIIVNVYIMRTKKEENDEMSLYNLREARAVTQKRMYRLISLIALIYLLISLSPAKVGLGLKTVVIPLPFLFIVLGLSELSVGLEFKKLEEK